MAQGQKKFSKNPAKKSSSSSRKAKQSKKDAPRVGRRVKAPRRPAAISSTRLKTDLTRALVQKIEHDVARQATSNDVNLRVVAMPSSQDSKKPAGGSGAAKAGVAAAKKKKS
ncbi:leydig cell tumor 10 kDa protein homolog [Sycon ciliatum]|uniref:leydig cell tumor 10 kDa protein homolog n=1 Tax=Sycon ciliatum TaxID=27933 RepID=UPI0031F7007A|eukprot:scpid7017/ scgid23709/ 